MKTALFALVVASLVLMTASVQAAPLRAEQTPAVHQSRDAPNLTVPERVTVTTQSTDPDWLDQPRRTLTPSAEYEVTPDLEGRWHVFLDWYMLFMYLFGDGKGF